MQRFGRMMGKELTRIRLRVLWPKSTFEIMSTLYVPIEQINQDDVKSDAIRFRNGLSSWVEQIKERGL